MGVDYVFAPPPQRRAPYIWCFSELISSFWNGVTSLVRWLAGWLAAWMAGWLFLHHVEYITSLCYNMCMFIM